MYPRQRQATLQHQGYDVHSSSNSQRRPTPTYVDPSPGSFSAPVARLSKWPENVYFASDYIADKAAAATAAGVRRRAARRRTTGATKTAHGPRGTGGQHKPVTRVKKNTAPSRPSGGKRAVQHQSVQGHIERQEMKPVVVEDGEGERFLEESASALLHLHSRFFGGMIQEEDIVCRLCMLCREAGWMGSPLRVCPDLDPIVLDDMVVARLREYHCYDAGWRRSSTSRTCAKKDLPFSDGGLSFEAFYRILSQVASLVYPLEGRAMHRLLMEGVLPLAADSEPRRWSPSPELLYGRPALAALRMQRDALCQLYRTYDNIARTHAGSSGISQSLFLKMLTDLGVSPASISEQNAASVFDDVVRNGLPNAGTFRSLTRQPSRPGHRSGNVGDNFMTIGGHVGVHSSSRKPGGDRLCWSLFLEAMAALAVGAVKDGQGAATQRDRSRKPTSNPNHWDRTDRGCGTRERGGDAHETRLGSPGESHFPRRGVPRLSGEFSRSLEEGSERKSHERSAEHVLRKEKAGTRVAVATADKHPTAEPASERDRTPTYGRDFYHDSRRSFELMPTLPETDGSHEQAGSPLGSRSPPSLQQETPRAQRDNVQVKPWLSATRTSNPPPPATTAAERNNTVTTDNFVDSTPRAILHVNGQERGKTEHHRLIEHPPTAQNSTSATSSEGRHRLVQVSLPASPLNHDNVSVESSSLNAGHCRARDADKTRERGANRVVPSIAAADGGGQTFATRRSRHSVSLSCATTEVSRGSVDSREQHLRGLSTRQGMTVARSAAANSRPAAAASFSSFSKGVDSKDAGVLSPAPCHGSSPSAIASSEAPPEASAGFNGPTTRRAVVDLGLPPAEPPPGLQAHAADECAGLCRCRSCADSTGPVTRTTSCQCWLARKTTVGDGDTVGTLQVSSECAQQPPSARTSMEQTIAPSMIGTRASQVSKIDLGRYSGRHAAQQRVQKEGVLCPDRSGAKRLHCRDGRENEAVRLGGDDRNVAQREDYKEEREAGLDWASHADHVTMDFEAAGCTSTLFEELLEPSVVTVYSRHRKELLVLFQRYRLEPDGNRLPASCDQEASGSIGDSGIWRFVNDFPVLRRWAQGDSSILRLIVRASRGRGWQRCGEEEPARHPSGLSYFGFLEVLTRMAYATHGQKPLHRKLLDLIRALEIDDLGDSFPSA